MGATNASEPAGAGPSTAEALTALVEAGDRDGAEAAALALAGGTDLAGRAALVRRCTEVVKAGWWSEPASTAEQYEAAAVLVLALATAAELRALGRRRPVLDDLDRQVAVLSARPADVRDTWVALAAERCEHRELWVARRLVHAGLARPPDDGSYTIGLVAHPGAFDLTGSPGWRGHVSTLDVLRANPDLLVDEVWRVFEVEGGGENSLAAHDKYCSEQHSWRVALVTLAAEGALDRQRLLDASLDALQRGFAPFRAQWFSAFHEALAPTPDEQAARAGAYLALAASPVGPTVALALRALARVQAAGALDGVEAVEHLGPALLTKAKGSARRAVDLVARAADPDPARHRRAADVLVAALGHPAAEVQQAAVGHLRRWYPVPDAALAATATDLAASAHPATRAAVAAWTGAPAASSSTASSPAASTTAPVERPPAGRLALADPPASTLDLLALASAVLEGETTADEVEVLLAAIAARPLGADDGPDAAVAATLGRRAATLAAPQRSTDRPARRLVARAVVAWLAPDRLAATDDERDALATLATLDDLVVARAHALALALAERRSIVPVATPTSPGGGLDPAELVARLALPHAHAPTAELLVAALRLDPDPGRLAAAAVAAADTAAPPWLVAWITEWADHAARLQAAPRPWAATARRYGEYTHWDLGIDGLGSLAPPASPVAITGPTTHWGRFTQDRFGVAWMVSMAPALSGPLAAYGALAIGPTYGPREVSHGDPAWLEPLLEPTAVLGRDAALLVALALNDPRPEVHVLATDVAVAAFADDRLAPATLGQTIGQLASTGAVTPRRWGRTLADVAATDATSAAGVAAALAHAIAVVEPPRPHDLLALLELAEALALEGYRDAALDGGPTRAALARFAGGNGKTARVAARLLAPADGGGS